MIRADNLGFRYRCGRLVLEGIGFSVKGGECAAVLGNNGAGKSTLLKCLNGILPSKSGAVFLEGMDASRMGAKETARRMALVGQKEEAPRMSVYESVLLGRKPHMGFGPSHADHDMAERTIKRMGLEDMRDRNVCDLSGGEFQKVMLARALCQQPKVLLLDEPTSNLDLKNQHETLAIVSEASRKDGIAVIMAIHDIGLAIRYCCKFLTLKNRKLHSCGGIDTLTSECLKEVYGVNVKLAHLDGRLVAVPIL